MGAAAVETQRSEMLITWSDGSRGRFHALWLRDNCPSGGDRANAFRSFSVADLDPELSIVEASVDSGTVVIRFNDGHRSEYDLSWLRAHARPMVGGQVVRPSVITWRGDSTPLEFEFDTLSAGSAAHLDLLEAVACRGVALVLGSETDEAATVALAGLFGHIRETDFGRLFDIIFEGDSWTKSQTGDALDPHTDDPYRYTPSGASVLHCVESRTEGGESILVDGFAVAADLRRDCPEMFEILSTTAVPFIRHRRSVADQGEDVHLIAKAPIIAVDGDGEVCGIRFHERSMGVLDVDPDAMGDYYRALIRFTSMVTNGDYSTIVRLEPGEALLFDNQRVLHGRNAFDGRVGRRHLRLCTVDRDQFHSRLRRLREIHQRGGTDSWLPAGNLS